MVVIASLLRAAIRGSTAARASGDRLVSLSTHEVVLVDRKLGLLAAILVFHLDVMLGAAAAAAATGVRQRDVRIQRRREEIIIVGVLRITKQLERPAAEHIHRIVRLSASGTGPPLVSMSSGVNG